MSRRIVPDMLVKEGGNKRSRAEGTYVFLFCIHACAIAGCHVTVLSSAFKHFKNLVPSTFICLSHT